MFACKQSVLAEFFDLQKAYYITWRYHILHQLSSLKIIGNIGVFIQFFLHNRTFRVRVSSSVSSSYTQYEGVPQGCILSTTIFLIVINNIITSLPIGVKSSLYVADPSILLDPPPQHSNRLYKMLYKIFLLGPLIMVSDFQLLNPIQFPSPAPIQ